MPIRKRISDSLYRAVKRGGSLANIDLTDEELKDRMKVNAANVKTAKTLKMMEGAKKGIMTQEEYDLRRKNILRRRNLPTETGWLRTKSKKA